MRVTSRKTTIRVTLFVGVITALLAGAVACTWQPTLGARHTNAPSVLILAVENLGFNSFSCGDASGPPDDVLFESFCEESVRFTHAYTPSTMSQAALASLLTGLYPREHGVHHNGSVGLSSKFKTVAEVAREARLKTSFFSGGPPIFRRSGFSQGFDIFDDSIGLSAKSLYRPALTLVDLFLDWHRTSVMKAGFFSVLFFADPQFVDQPTFDDLGEVRESSYEGQIAETSESIETLVKEMKRRRIWDSTTVVLVGLNGQSSDQRASEPTAVDLFSETTRTVLMVKPAHQANPEYVKASNWKIDSNVSLVDLGETLFQILGGAKGRIVSKMGAVSLTGAFADPKATWDDDRDIVVESAWPEWKGFGGTRAALRKGPYFYLFDENDQLYNTLTDNLEARSLPLGEPGTSKLRDQFAQTLRDQGYSPWRVSSRADLERTVLGQDLFRDRDPTPETMAALKKLTLRYKDDRELRGWRAIVDLQTSDWADLKSIAGKDRPLWTYVADVNLKVKTMPLLNPCLKALFTRVGERGKDCGDDLSRSLALWADETKPRRDRERAMEAFNKLDLLHLINDRVSKANLMAGDVWDVLRARWSEPTLTDLMLALPDMKKYKARSRKNDGT